MDIIKVEPVIERRVRNFPFGNRLTEFPWDGRYNTVIEAAYEEMFAVWYEDEIVGGMHLRIEREPELVFFELDKRYRSRGIGRTALEILFERLMLQKFKFLTIQTGRPQIYTGMGFDFRIIDRGHIRVALYEPNLKQYELPGKNTQGTLIYSEKYLVHDYPNHPESGSRIEHAISRFQKDGILEKLHILAPRPALRDEICSVHTFEMFEYVEKCALKGERVAKDIPTGPDSYDLACLSAGGAVLAGEIIASKNPVFVLCRPPGHHANRQQSRGFCFFNNMAILAVALQKKGYNPMIIDWDVHHGNGTQEILYDRPIMYVSLHQKYLYPFSGSAEETGQGYGTGYTRNFPMRVGVEDEEYLDIFSNTSAIASEVKPDILLISAGQDGHVKDPLAGMRLSTNAYYEMGRRVGKIAREHCEGRLILILEGGYHLIAGASSLSQAVKGILETIRK